MLTLSSTFFLPPSHKLASSFPYRTGQEPGISCLIPFCNIVHLFFFHFISSGFITLGGFILQNCVTFLVLMIHVSCLTLITFLDVVVVVVACAGSAGFGHSLGVHLPVASLVS